MATLDFDIDPVRHPQADAMLRDLKAAINTYNLREESERSSEATVHLLLESIVRLTHALARVELTCALRHHRPSLDTQGNVEVPETQLRTNVALLDAMISPHNISWPSDDLFGGGQS